jgi:hypothetical protein
MNQKLSWLFWRISPITTELTEKQLLSAGTIILGKWGLTAAFLEETTPTTKPKKTMKLTVNMNRTKYISAVLIAITGLGILQAKATAPPPTFSSDLTVGNTAISGFTEPFGNVLVTLTSPTTATVKFTSDAANGNIYLFAGAQGVDVNVNASSFTVSGITASNAGTGFSPGPFTAMGSQNVDGFGVFNETLDGFDGFTHSADLVSFTLTNTSGIWASASSVLTPNSSGFDAAAHIFVTSSPADASNTALATGFAAEVPEPATAFFLPFGGILAFYLRFRSKR